MRQPWNAVRIALLGYGLVLYLLAQVAALQWVRCLPAMLVQGVEQALPGQCVFTNGGEAFAECLPCRCTCALGDGAV